MWYMVYVVLLGERNNSGTVQFAGIGCGFKLLGSIIFIIVWLLICRRTDTQLVTMEPENRLLRLCFQTADDRPQTNSLNGSEVTTETHL